MLTIACLVIAALGPAPAAAPDAAPKAERLAALAEYHSRRDAVDATAEQHFALAEWCEAKGLRDEANAHYTVATRIDPDLATAWMRLGFRRFEGAWRSEAQIAGLLDDRRERKEADARYRPWFQSWADWLRGGGKADDAVKVLDTVSDPRAVPSIRAVFGQKSSGQQGLAVRMLDRIDSNESTLALSSLAVDATTPKVRTWATQALDSRDPRVYVGFLINRIREPVRYEVRRSSRRDALGELWVEEKAAIVDRVYELPGSPSLPSGSSTPIRKLDSSGIWRNYTREATPDLGAFARSSAEGIASVERRMKQDIRKLELENIAIERANDRLIPVLYRETGQALGADRQAWSSWWSTQLGYGYDSRAAEAAAMPKPVVVQYIQAAPPPPVAVFVTDTLRPSFRSCFAGGTIVQTELGPRPIEGLKVGDLVLSRDTKSGSLSYKPIVTTFHNPPASTLRVDLGDESIVATGIHRFWRVGLGWTMARDLKPGDRVNLVRGVATVVSVRPDEVQKVFNLEVLDDADFFVGSIGALVHDNTIVPLSTHPFDAERLP